MSALLSIFFHSLQFCNFLVFLFLLKVAQDFTFDPSLPLSILLSPSLYIQSYHYFFDLWSDSAFICSLLTLLSIWCLSFCLTTNLSSSKHYPFILLNHVPLSARLFFQLQRRCSLYSYCFTCQHSHSSHLQSLTFHLNTFLSGSPSPFRSAPGHFVSYPHRLVHGHLPYSSNDTS